ncbi:hypothetical protein AWL63_06260 [Sphingomonas panacis]|uniref:Uncharacterized protein n=1 Tax=Sphingomonas panacis TaxID=1560345 RepID=A0A1B3Z873_9SPHN|nr:hypothetical protein AWL63_06260 [Sphingomonas panacis]
MISGGRWNGFTASGDYGRRMFGREISKLRKASWQTPSEQLRDFVLRPGQIERKQQTFEHPRQRGFTRQQNLHRHRLRFRADIGRSRSSKISGNAFAPQPLQRHSKVLGDLR